jgi:hypothetical protein
MGASDLSADELFQRLYLLKRKGEDKVPKGYKSAKEWGVAWSMTRQNAQEYLNLAIKKKLMKRIYLKRKTGRFIRWTAYYGEVA